jgi:hypothetical protein
MLFHTFIHIFNFSSLMFNIVLVYRTQQETQAASADARPNLHSKVVQTWRQSILLSDNHHKVLVEIQLNLIVPIKIYYHSTLRMTDRISPARCPPITTLFALFYHFVNVRLNFDIALVCRRPKQLPLMRVQIIIPKESKHCASQFLSSRITRSCVQLMPAPAAAAAAPAAEPRSGGCGRCCARCSGRGRAAECSLRCCGWGRPGRRMVMIDLQCNVHTAICVLYRVGSPGWIRQKTPISTNTKYDIEAKKASISYTDIEGLSVDSDIEKSSRSGYNDIEVFNFDVDVSSISEYNDHDIEVLNFDIDVSSISCWVDIDLSCFDIEYRTGSISNVTTFDMPVDVFQILSTGIRYRIPNIPYRVVISY